MKKNLLESKIKAGDRAEKYIIRLDKPKTKVMFDTLEEAKQWFKNVGDYSLKIEKVTGFYKYASYSNGFLTDYATLIFQEA